MRVVINACFGGFSLSEAGMLRYAEIKGLKVYVERDKFWTLTGPIFYTVPKDERTPVLEGLAWHKATLEERQSNNEAYRTQTLSNRPGNRADPALVQAVEELGPKVNGRQALLKVVEIPDNLEYEICDYDGNEHIAEVHRTWS